MPELQPYRGDLQYYAQKALEENPEAQVKQADLQKLQWISGLFSGADTVKRRVVLITLVVWTLGGFLLIGFGSTFFSSAERGIFFNVLPCLLMPLLFVGAIVILVGLPLIWDKIVGQRLGTPSLNASAEELRPGDLLELAFQQPVNGPVDVQAVELALIRRETATYTSGTDTTTVHHDHVAGEVERMGRHLEKGYMLEERAEFTLPPDAMHTFMASHNKIQWFVTVQVRLARWPDFRDTYQVFVSPEREA